MKKSLTLLLALTGMAALLYLDTQLGMAHHPHALSGAQVDYGVLFTTGLLTSVHCVGMCGPLVLSYATQGAKTGRRAWSAHLSYAVGKTASYTAIGALFGLLGSFVAITPMVQASVGMAAGVFLLLFGLSSLNLFPALSRFRIKTPPGFMRMLGVGMRRYRHPLAIGAFNGLMVVCGPLQAMYILAAAAGSAEQGAKLLLAFGLGTLPVMMGFGALTSLASASLAPKLLRLTGIVVMAMGAVMLNRGLLLSGSGYDIGSVWQKAQAVWLELQPSTATDAPYQAIETDVSGQGFSPDQLILRKGVPVRWTIHSEEIPSCSNEIRVPDLGIAVPVHQGKQIIEFTPQETGVIAWSCGMGMQNGHFVVVDDAEKNGKNE